MKKTIKILTIVSGAIMILSMLALIICVLLQGTLTYLFYSTSSMGEYFIFPVARFVYVFGILLCSVLLFFSAGLRKLGMWAEIVAIPFIAVFFPFVQWIISMMQTTLGANAKGSLFVAATAAVNNLASMATCLVPLAASVLLVVSGLSIASKIYVKK